MQLTTLSLLLLALAFVMFHAGRERSLHVVGGPGHSAVLHSRPRYYGYFVAMRSLAPALLIVLVWLILEARIVVALAIDGVSDAWSELGNGELDLLIRAPHRALDTLALRITVEEGIRSRALAAALTEGAVKRPL